MRESILAGALPRPLIRARLQHTPPLIAGMSAPEEQLQPCGVDLTVATVARFDGPGTLGAGNLRHLPAQETIPWGEETLWLAPGGYLVTFVETVALPLDLMALAWPRSSLLRMGVSLHTAVWDPGYQGRGQALLTVHNPAGFALAPRARICQLVFFPLAGATDAGYAGRYQGEHLGEPS